MKYFIELDMNDQEDCVNLKQIAAAKDMCLALYKISEYFRTKRKYGCDEFKGLDTEAAILVLESSFHDVLTTYNINLDELVY